MKSGTIGKRLCTGMLAALTLALAMGADAAAPYGRYATGVDTVVDTETQLTWQRVASSSTFSSSAASSYCQSLSLGGFSSGWRLPTVKELESLVDETVVGPAIDTVAFTSTPASAFWTSTTFLGGSNEIFIVDFFDGEENWNNSTTSNYVRCVR